ncbi:MAG: hypothetical protein AAF212_12905 [Verrucomicrobiota bacterium]
MLSYDAIDDYRQELNRADALFYNLGNNAAFHREIIRILRQFPGVAIMHDLSLFECVSSIYRERLGGDRMFLDLVRHLYGVRSEGIVEDWLLAGDEARREIDAASECPFAGHATLGAWGLVTHTEIPQGHELHHDVRPQWTLALPFPGESELPASRVCVEPFDLLVFGYIGGPNRRLVEVLNALSRYARRDCFILNIAGDLNPSLEIPRKVEELGLGSNVRIHGFLSDEALDELLSRVSLVLNLRYPTRGEASGSLLRAWSCGATVAVSDTGSYSMIPDDVVFKIRPEHETEDLFALWDQVLGNPRIIEEMRVRGFEFLRKNHSIDSYVNAILDIAKTPSQKRAGAVRPMLEQRFGLLAASVVKFPEPLDEKLLARMSQELEGWFD